MPRRIPASATRQQDPNNIIAAAASGTEVRGREFAYRRRPPTKRGREAAVGLLERYIDPCHEILLRSFDAGSLTPDSHLKQAFLGQTGPARGASVGRAAAQMLQDLTLLSRGVSSLSACAER